MGKIIIELEVHEAIVTLAPITDRALELSKLAATSENADLTAQILHRVATRLTDALYPDTCRWLDDEPCERPIASEGWCTLHLDHQVRVAEILA